MQEVGKFGVLDWLIFYNINRIVEEGRLFKGASDEWKFSKIDP